MPVVSSLVTGIKMTLSGVTYTVNQVYIGTTRVFGLAPTVPIDHTLYEEEAENGTVVAMTTTADASASGGYYVLVDTASTGSITFSLENMAAGSYVLEILGDFATGSSNSVDVEVNSSPIGTFSPSLTTGFEWKVWITRVTLISGTNEVVLNGNEAGLKIDKIRLTLEEIGPPNEPDPPASSRVAWQWPGHETDCPFNLPMNDGATFYSDSHAKNLVFTSSLSQAWLQLNSNVSIRQASINDPMASLTATLAGFGTANLNVPADLQDSGFWVIVDTDGINAYHIYNPVRISYTEYTCSSWRLKDITGSMLPADLGGYAGTRNTGFSEMSGAIRGWEMNDPDLPIRHSLAIIMGGLFTDAGYVWPAAHDPQFLVDANYPTGGPGPLRIGELIAIPQTVDLTTVTVGWSSYAIKIAYALQRFGAYIVGAYYDQTNHEFIADDQVNAIASTAYYNRSLDLIQLCRVVSNADSSNPKGTGSAIYTGAPSL